MFKKRNFELFIVDLFVAIQKIKTYTSEFKTAEEFQYSSIHWDATIRELEIIGETLNKLLSNEFFNENSPKYFRKVVNFRNVIVHSYFGIDLNELWDVINSKLPILEDDLENFILNNNIKLIDAIVSEIEEYKRLRSFHIVEYLKQLNIKFTIN